MQQLINQSLVALNKIGAGFCSYAVSTFVQSSLLIILLLIIDFVLRRHVRAVLRYCVWLLVFVKLILPPTLSLPTGIGYWCGDFLSAEQITSGPVSDIPAIEPAELAMSEDFATGTPVAQAQPAQTFSEEAVSPATSVVSSLPSVTWQAIVFLIWLVGILVFSVLLVQRMLFVKGLIAQSKPAQGRLLDTLNQCGRQIGIRRDVELKLSSHLQSPAVCRLFKPVVLMPTSLLEKLSREKLRAVLIHELAHIKRGDLWVNFVQTLLQIIYFYNPFVWLANSMVRRIREQAIDEMVLVALGRGAKSYSNTLIDIAEMAFWRTNFSLRLIGVAESKKALEGRIKYMLARPIPKSAKVGIVGLLIIIIAGAVLLPMAKAKDKKGQQSQFIATLSNGVTVELVGVCEHPSEGKQWWRPDGSLLSEAPYEKTNSYADPNDNNDRQIAVRFSRCQLDDIQLAWKRIPEAIEGSGAYGSALVGGERVPDLAVVTASFPENQNTVTISLGVAAGVWETYAVTDGKKQVSIAKGDKKIRFGRAYKADGRARLMVWWNFYDVAYRLVAIDVSGGSKIPNLVIDGEYTFDVPPARIKEFQFQTRPYDWVTIRNVSLQPGVKTDVQVQMPAKDSAPIVVSTTPVAFANDVSPSLRRVTVTFDQPMMDGSWSWTGGGVTFPETTGKPHYNTSQTTCSLPVKLEPGKVYWVGINNPSYKNFKNSDGVPAKRYVILFATKDKEDKATPIPKDLLDKAKTINEAAQSISSESVPYTQMMFNDIQPDGTILFKTTIKELNRSGRKIKTKKFINSDFVHVTSMSDGHGQPIKFTSTHEGDIYQYKLTFNEPVLPGEVMQYSSEGKITGLVKPVPGSENQFRYYMRHWPAAGQVTLRIETYLLPEGAELISTTPEDMQRRTKNGQIELYREKMVPADGSITTTFKYRLAGSEAVQVEEGQLSKKIDKQSAIYFSSEDGAEENKPQIILRASVFSVRTPLSSITNFLHNELGLKNTTTDLTDAQAEQFKKWMATIPNMTTITSPTAIVFDRQPADLSVTTQHEYIADYEKSADSPVEYKPEVKKFITGVKLNFTPELKQDKNLIVLTLNLKKTDLIKLESKLHASGNQIQVPEIHTAEIYTKVSVPQGKHFLVISSGRSSTGNSIQPDEPAQQTILLVKTDVQVAVGSAERVDYSSVTIEEGVGFDDIIVGDVNCTGEFIKSKLGKPDKEVKDDKTNGWWLNYREKYGLGFWLNENNLLREIRLNEGFKGKLTSGISMSSTKEDVFDTYGKPFEKKAVSDLTKHFDNQVLYEKKRLFGKPQNSKIFYTRQGLLFWFEGDKILQIVIHPKNAKTDVQVEVEAERTALLQNLKQIALAAIMYADDHNGQLAENLEELKEYVADENLFTWALENVKYLGKGTRLTEPASTKVTKPMAYYKTVLEKTNGTVVVFLDGHAEFVKGRRLQELGIRPGQ